MASSVAVSAWTCCDPGCTNMAAQQEASLGLSKCAGCGEARYCSKPNNVVQVTASMKWEMEHNSRVPMAAVTEAKALERMLECQKLVALVAQDQAAELSPQEAVPASLAAGVELLSTRLGEWSGDGGLHSILDPAAEAASSSGGSLLAMKLQSIYCKGSLFTRLCTPDTMSDNPATVASFLQGVSEVAAALPTATVDYASLKALACHLDSKMVQASKDPAAIEEGTSPPNILHFLRQMCVAAIGGCMTDSRTPKQWGLDAASPALEAMLHLALGELTAASQIATERHSLAEPPLHGSTYFDQAEQPGITLQPREHTRIGCAAWVLAQVGSLAMEAAELGALSLQRLVGCGADLVKVVDHCLHGDSQPNSLQSKMLGPAIYGVSTVLQLQLLALTRLGGSLLSRAQKSALKDALDQRMHWVEAAAVLAKVLHYVADAAAGSSMGTAQRVMDLVSLG
ncbi:hypothetical protein N2152v2_008680 [Parachlorella kessleri]